jgi:hypothetical protein
VNNLHLTMIEPLAVNNMRASVIPAASAANLALHCRLQQATIQGQPIVWEAYLGRILAANGAFLAYFS